jgi:hypothetical protein
MRQDFGCGYTSEGLRRLVPDHLGFVGIFEDLQQGGNGVRRKQLAEDKCNFMPVSETMSKIWNDTAW